MKLPKQLDRLVGKIVNGVTSAVSQTSTDANDADYPQIEGMRETCFRTAADSFVLLRNEKETLPFSPDRKIAVFGRCAYDTFFVGYGSGGDVNPHYTVSIMDGIRSRSDLKTDAELDRIYRQWIKKNPANDGYWGHWPMSREEMHVSEATAAAASERADCALIVFGRAAGEDRENTLTKGSFFLTEEEENILDVVSLHFEKIAVILNIGGIMDLSGITQRNIPCIGICWQGGMETGNAVAAILSGAESPSGKLTDTIAAAYADYPSSDNFGGKKKNHYEEDIYVGYRYFETFAPECVLFPFGFGLTYSAFRSSDLSVERSADRTKLCVTVTNVGKTSARETVQIYFSRTGSLLSAPSKALCGFRKTNNLAPGESETLTIEIADERLSSYDDAGATDYRYAYLLPKGEYVFHVGFNCRDTTAAGGFTLEADRLIRQVRSHAAPQKEERLMRLVPVCTGDHIYRSYEPAPVREYDLRQRILDALPPEIPQETYNGETWEDVRSGKLTEESFLAKLSDVELEAISRGDYVMNSPLGPKGNAGTFGGVLESLREKGIPAVTTTDGPSGIRLAARSALLPCGTALACTFEPELTENLYKLLGLEMADRGSDVLLAPGMNIHRDPLGGRNFEYFSEDPLVSGLFGAAVVKGLRDSGVNACPKHFACNNQETNRIHNDSVVSERALREIYLKGFEICVKEAAPDVIMTSYNKINGVWGHYHYELVTDVLRGEWGYDGVVITDWWMRKSASPEFPGLRDQAYRVRAGVDVLMPGGERTGKREPDGTLLETLGQPDGITRGELQQTAKHVLRFAVGTKKYTALKEADNHDHNEL